MHMAAQEGPQHLGQAGGSLVPIRIRVTVRVTVTVKVRVSG